jgi:carboxylesterase
VPVQPGREPYIAAGGRVGVLVVHGFTGSPVSMRPWAEYLAAAGLSVRMPRLPGHGTRWQDLNDTRWPDWYGEVARGFDALRMTCDHVFVAGLSMGGTLALRLAGERGTEVAGVIVVNAALDTADKRAWMLPYVSKVVRSFPPIANDIHRPGVDEGGYPRLPLRAAASLQQLWGDARTHLGTITAPVLAFRSAVDHVVPASSLALLRAGATGTTVTERVLANSYHVATLDYDAPQIFAESLTFIREHAAHSVGHA